MQRKMQPRLAGQAPAEDLQEGLPGALETLRERYAKEVWHMAYRHCHDEHEAGDITQETFLRLLKRWESGERIAYPRAWLLRVAGNLARDHRKSASRRKCRYDPEALENLRSREPAPDEALECKEREEQWQRLLCKLRQALATIPDEERDVVVMHYAQGMSCRRIEEVTGRSKSTLHRNLPLLRARLRAALEHPDPGS